MTTRKSTEMIVSLFFYFTERRLLDWAFFYSTERFFTLESVDYSTERLSLYRASFIHSLIPHEHWQASMHSEQNNFVRKKIFIEKMGNELFLGWKKIRISRFDKTENDISVADHHFNQKLCNSYDRKNNVSVLCILQIKKHCESQIKLTHFLTPEHSRWFFVLSCIHLNGSKCLSNNWMVQQFINFDI